LHEEPSLSFAKNIQLGAANLSKRILELLDMARGEVGVLKLNRKKLTLWNFSAIPLIMYCLKQIAANLK
jgi:hypothetical protein